MRKRNAADAVSLSLLLVVTVVVVLAPDSWFVENSVLSRVSVAVLHAAQDWLGRLGVVIATGGICWLGWRNCVGIPGLGRPARFIILGVLMAVVASVTDPVEHPEGTRSPAATSGPEAPTAAPGMQTAAPDQIAPH